MRALAKGNENLLFQSPCWWDVLRDGFSVRCWGIKVIEDGKPVALLPVFEKKIATMRLTGSPLRGTFTPYIGLVALQEIDREQQAFYLTGVCEILRSRGGNYITFGFREGEGFNGNLPSENGWQIEAPGTFLLDMEPDLEAMWKRMTGRGRNMARKAKKNGVIVRRLSGTSEEISLFYSMLKETFAKSGSRPPHPLRFYKALIRHLMPSGMLLFLGAEVNGSIVAMGLFPYNKQEIHYLSGTSLPEAGRVAANNLIQWEVIKFAALNNIRFYDLGGTGIPAIDKFKASFGARRVNYLRYTWLTPRARIAYRIYTMFLGLRKKVRS